MILANVESGTTECFDLDDPDQYRNLLDLISSGQVTALSLLQNGVQHALPLPKRFSRRPIFGAETIINGTKTPIGERIYAQADNVRISLSLTYRSKLVRCNLVRTGKMKYNPPTQGWG